MSNDEAAIEAQIQEKGLNAPRLTPAMIDAKIIAEDYQTFPSTTVTICALTLANGYVVTGESAAASPDNFDADIGRTIARENARNKIWALEGYLLRERLSQEKQAKGRVMRAKLRVGSTFESDPRLGPSKCETVTFFGVAANHYDPDGLDENNTFAKFSPSAMFQITITNPDLIGCFDVDETFYADFTHAPH